MKQNKNHGRVSYVWILAGGYLLYLAFRLLDGARRGETDRPLVGVACGILFIAVGVFLLVREWRRYRSGPGPEDTTEEEPGESAEAAGEPGETDAEEARGSKDTGESGPDGADDADHASGGGNGEAGT